MADLIDEIEALRARNNTTWVSLVRLALEVAPERAKAILRQINETDAEISKRAKELANP